jgi:hypothetical protein
MASTQATLSDLKINPKIRAMKLLKIPHSRASRKLVQSAQDPYPRFKQQARTPHQAAFSFWRHPGHFSLTYREQAAQ